MIQRHKLTENDFRGVRFSTHPKSLKGNNDILVLTQPQIVEGVHRAYLEAGADIIETNTFNANRISQADYGLETVVYELNKEAARIAQGIATEFTNKDTQKPRFVAGSMGKSDNIAKIAKAIY